MTTPTMFEFAQLLQDHPARWDSRHDATIARFMHWWQDEKEEWHAVGNWFGDGLRQTSYAVALPAFTNSLDAAVKVVPVGWKTQIGDKPGPGEGRCVCRVWLETPSGGIIAAFEATAVNGPLAICAAGLKARDFLVANPQLDVDAPKTT